MPHVGAVVITVNSAAWGLVGAVHLSITEPLAVTAEAVHDPQTQKSQRVRLAGGIAFIVGIRPLPRIVAGVYDLSSVLSTISLIHFPLPNSLSLSRWAGVILTVTTTDLEPVTKALRPWPRLGPPRLGFIGMYPAHHVVNLTKQAVQVGQRFPLRNVCI